MNCNEEVKKILNTHRIEIALNSQEEFQADNRGVGNQEEIAGYYLQGKVEQPLAVDALGTQEYYYRAMSYSEARWWLNAWKQGNKVEELEGLLKDKETGIHFTTGAAYSKRNITNHSKEQVLLEFHAPKLVKRFQKIGVGRKEESNGEWSYGIGYKETTALPSTAELDAKIEEKYQSYQNDSVIGKLREWWEIPEPRSLEEKRQFLKVVYFLKVLEGIKILYVRNS